MAFQPITRGRDGAELQSQTYTFDRSRGHTYAEELKALSITKAVAYYNARVNYVQRAQMKLSDGMAELRLEWGGSESGSAPPTSLNVTIDRWEVVEPTIERDLFQHPDFLEQIRTFATTQEYEMDVVKIIRQHAGSAQSGSASAQSSMFEAINSYLTSKSLSTIAKTDAASVYWLKFYRLYANNQTHYQDSTWALRHTTNAPANWARNVADTNRNKVYTHGQFLAEVTNGVLWIFPLPARLQFKLTNAVDDFTVEHVARTDFAIGWLKGASSEATVGGGRIEIQTSYKLDQWGIPPYRMVT